MLALYAALLLGYTIHFIYCIWGNLRITVAELIAAAAAIAGSDTTGSGEAVSSPLG